MEVLLATLGVGTLAFGGPLAAMLGAAWGWWLRTRAAAWPWILTAQTLISIPIVTAAAITLGATDPHGIVLDEFVAASVLATLGTSPWRIASGLALFGALDVLKPWPLNHLETLPGGFGIVLDDLGAALLAILLVWLTRQAYVTLVRGEQE